MITTQWLDRSSSDGPTPRRGRTAGRSSIRLQASYTWRDGAVDVDGMHEVGASRGVSIPSDDADRGHRGRHRRGRRGHAVRPGRAAASRSSELRAFASARSAGRHVAFGDGEVLVEDAATADLSGLDLAIFSAGRGTSLAAGPPLRGGRGGRGRQLLGVAHGPRRPPGRARGQRRCPRPPPQGDRGQPQLHDHGGHAGAAAAARRGGAPAAGRQHLPGGVGRRPGRRRGARRAGGRDGADVGRAGPRRVGRRRARRRPSSPAPIAFNVMPLRGLAPGRRRQRRDRRGAEAPGREPEDPRDPRPRRCRARA